VRGAISGKRPKGCNDSPCVLLSNRGGSLRASIPGQQIRGGVDDSSSEAVPPGPPQVQRLLDLGVAQPGGLQHEEEHVLLLDGQQDQAAGVQHVSDGIHAVATEPSENGGM